MVVAFNPEFLRATIRDFKFPDRIVVGTSDERGRKVLGETHRPLTLNQAPLMYTARRTAELIRYAANAFLATKITFINEIAESLKGSAPTCRKLRGLGFDNRIGSKLLHAEPGFGGSCFPKDTRALVKIALDHDVRLRIVEAVPGVNNRKRAMARKAVNAAGGNLRGKTVAVLWLTHGCKVRPRSACYHDWPRHRALDPVQIELTVLHPLDHDHQRVDVLHALVGFVGPSWRRPRVRTWIHRRQHNLEFPALKNTCPQTGSPFQGAS